MIFDTNFNYLFVVLILFSVFYLFLQYKSNLVTYINTKSGRQYLVRKCDDNVAENNNSVAAANLLDDLAENGIILINHFNTYTNDRTYEHYAYYQRFKDFIRRLTRNYDPNTISESMPNNEYTSYTINKGKKIVFCIRQKPNSNTPQNPCGDLVSLNTMMFVFLHELAHLGTCGIGHHRQFWCNMAFLLKVGEEIGIYDPLNMNNDIPYCGINITSAPDICPGHIPEQSCTT